MTATQHTCVVRAQLFLFLEASGTYEEFGSVGCAIIGTLSSPPAFKMGCYNEKNEYLCTTNITTSNESCANVALQSGGYVSFKDDIGRSWSMQFEDEMAAIEFVAHVAVAMYGVAGQPEESIVACDVATGRRERMVFANDRIKCRYQAWVVQKSLPGRDLPKLGSRLEGNIADEKPYAFNIPANHLSVTPDMVGFEGMIIGMGEDGRRVIVIPVKAKRGGGPNVHMCFYTHILRKKEGSEIDNGRGGAGGMGMVPAALQQLAHTAPISGLSLAPVAGNGVYGGHVSAAPRSSSPVAPPGFSSEQWMIIDRLRDQVQALSQQLREARTKLSNLDNDIKTHEKKVKPQSLASAQIEYSVQKVLADTAEAKDALAEKDTLLRQMEEKNRDLQQKLEKFTNTANQLAQERKASLNNAGEERLDQDRRIAQLQGQLTRIQGEREDLLRHLTTVKRLLSVSDQDAKTEKSKLQISMVSHQTNESKLSAVEEQMTEETARRRILEAKVVTLGDELRTALEEIRAKESQMEDRRKKMEIDKLHYTQLLEDERSQAAAELREMRQELIDELALRDRRYQEERARVARDAYERGRIQGIEDGQTEELLESDAQVQRLTLESQRHRAEVESMKIRLRQSREEADNDERRLTAQVEALMRAAGDLDTQNAGLESEMTLLKQSKEASEDDTYATLFSVLKQLSQPISKRDLLAAIHCLRIGKPVDFAFELHRQEEQQRRIATERSEVKQWVADAVSGVPTAMPEMRTPYVPETVLPSAADSLPPKQLTVATLPAEFLEIEIAERNRLKEESLKFDPELMERRYKEILSQLNDEIPELGLFPKKSAEPPQSAELPVTEVAANITATMPISDAAAPPPQLPDGSPALVGPLPPPQLAPPPVGQQQQWAPQPVAQAIVPWPAMDGSPQTFAAAPAQWQPPPPQAPMMQPSQLTFSHGVSAAEIPAQPAPPVLQFHNPFATQVTRPLSPTQQMQPFSSQQNPTDSPFVGAAGPAASPLGATVPPATPVLASVSAAASNSIPTPPRDATPTTSEAAVTFNPHALAVRSPSPAAEERPTEYSARSLPVGGHDQEEAKVSTANLPKSDLFNDSDTSDAERADVAGGNPGLAGSSTASAAVPPPKRIAPSGKRALAFDSSDDDGAVLARATPAAVRAVAKPGKALIKKSMFDDSSDSDNGGQAGGAQGKIGSRPAPAPRGRAPAGKGTSALKARSMFDDSDSE